MELRWNLDALFTSFDAEDFKKSMEELDLRIKEIRDWAEKNLINHDEPVRKMEEYITQFNVFQDLFSRLGAFARLSISVDAKNEKALQVIEQLENKMTALTQPKVKFKNWLGELDHFEELINSSPKLQAHQLFLEKNKEAGNYLLSEEGEYIVAKMANTGSKSWNKLQNAVSSTLLVEITLDGEEKKLPLPVVRNLAYSSKPEVRKTAYEAELEAYKKIEESSAAALNGIKGEVITVANLRGYASPLEETLIESNMEKETLDAMLTAMKESLPAFRKYFRKKAELLGHTGGLPFYDLFAPMGSIDMEFTYEEARDFIVENYRSFSDELADFALHAFENQWIDAEPRDGKRGGAFCANLHSIKESRVLTNYNGSYSNVTTLAHELGHGYHGHCLKDVTALNSKYPMPLAETASIFAETIVNNAALKTASEKEAFGILESDISTAGQVIVDIYCRFLFESELFEQRKDHSLSVQELKDLMLQAQKDAYGDGLDPEVLHPYMWANKPHYYNAKLNFYNYPYAFGLLFAKGLYAEYLKQGDAFVEKYDELLKATGCKKIKDVAELINIDVNSVDFWCNSLKLIEEDIERFIELADSMK